MNYADLLISSVLNESSDSRILSRVGRLTVAHIPIQSEDLKETSHHGIVDYVGRKIVAVKFGATHVPFYCSTGTCPKDGVYPGRWYPTAGMSHKWINKTKDINKYYGHRNLRAAGEELDRVLGDMREVQVNPLTGKHIPSLSTEDESQDVWNINPKHSDSYHFLNHAFGGTARVGYHPYRVDPDVVYQNIENLSHIANNLDMSHDR